jgi:predicted O-methyltransferase YrrM
MSNHLTAMRPVRPFTLDPDTECVLAELEAREEQEKTIAASLRPGNMKARRDEFLLSVGAAAGTLMHLLAVGSGARDILELGTSYGYSTVWLAHAARATGGRVVTVDVSADKQAHARLVLTRAGLDGVVMFRTADALEFLAAERGPYDLVLLDVWKEAYVPCIDVLLERLRPGATIVADNVIEPRIARAEAARYLAHVNNVADLRTVVLPVGNGLAISRYKVSTPESATRWPRE